MLMAMFSRDAGRAMGFLDRRGRALQRLQIERVRLHKRLCHGDDVADQPVQQVETHALAHHDAQDFLLFFVRRERVVCRDE